jgi:ribonuclease BN (tRNA processing enzyme)
VRLTVVGSGTSEPQPETAASGILIETRTFGVLVDCGQGVVRELLSIRDPRALDAIVVGHMHADHYIGLISLRYLMPWNGVADRLQVYLPPGGRDRIGDLASAISERPDFFDDAFDIVEYDPDGSLDVGDMRISFIAGRHYIPAWGCSIEAIGDGRIIISGDTGPNEDLVTAARGADVLVAEATLASPDDDDPERGHLTPEEALDIAARAGVPRTVLVHYPADLRDRIDAACARMPGATAGRAGLVVEVDAIGDDPTPGADETGTGDLSVDGVAPATLR